MESEYLKAVYALHFLIRKAAHFGIFMLLGISVLQVLRTFKLKWIFRILITLGICLLYAMTDEFHQLFVVGRSGLVFDVIVDFAGSLLGMFVSVAISLLISQRIKEKQEEKAEKAA